MKIAEMLQMANYSRIVVGDRWLTCGGKGEWKVLERKNHSKITKEIIHTKSEDEAVAALLEGEELYSDICLAAKSSIGK